MLNDGMVRLSMAFALLVVRAAPATANVAFLRKSRRDDMAILLWGLKKRVEYG